MRPLRDHLPVKFLDGWRLRWAGGLAAFGRLGGRRFLRLGKLLVELLAELAHLGW